MDCSIVWFRRDLRLLDNEAVTEAAKSKNCLFVFVIDPWYFKLKNLGILRVKFLFDSLAALDESLQKHGNRLTILHGESVAMITELLNTLKQNGIQPTLHFNYDVQGKHGLDRDNAVTKYCRSNDVQVHQWHNFFLLHDESKMDEWWKRYYEYQHANQHELPKLNQCERTITLIVKSLPSIEPKKLTDTLGIKLPEPKQSLFVAGENAARLAVYYFLKNRVDGYRWKISRPYLAQLGATSLIGPHLAFGTISNRAVFQAAVNHKQKLEAKQPKKAFDIATYLDRLRWRDSFTQRLWFHPELSWKNRFREFDEIYSNEELTGQKLEYFVKWQNGETGFPLLDAAMRQLKHDGFINFRMRAMSATFLIINCGISWHHGARHFMNCLVDGDIAINHWQWQMQAGITNPLSPTFRIYSPTRNFKDRDPDADYVHYWLPETKSKNVDKILKEAKPMLDYNETRKINGKVVSNLRKAVRSRVMESKGIELDNAQVAKRVVDNYSKRSADRYKRYIK